MFEKEKKFDQSIDMECECISRLEDLPDELFILICRYLNIYEILNSFTCLNNRLSKTINEFTEKIDLNLIPLKLRNRFLDQIFPDIKFNIQSIIFTDDLQHFPFDLEEFPNLQSIHFLTKYSPKYLLNVNEIKIDLVSGDLQIDLLNHFFSSSKSSNLQSLSLTSYHGFTFSNIQLTNSTRMKSLTINLKNNVDLFALLHLLSSTVQCLNLHILYNGPFQSISSLPLKLNHLRDFHLKTTFEDSIRFKQLEKLIVESFVSLQILSIETLTRDENYINGYQWEEFLTKLIYLKSFVCSIRYRFKIDENENKQIREENLFNSFSTDFWLNQRKWFINSYSTISNPDQTYFYKTKTYGKLFLHTIPFPYPSMDATMDVYTAKSTINQSRTRGIYSNVRHLYYDGENIPIEFEHLKNILYQFKSINELKLDRLIIHSSSWKLFDQINLRHLKKLIIYNNTENNPFKIDFLNFSSMYNLRYIRIPQILLPDSTQMPKQLQTLILTECRHWNFDFIHKLKNLRLLRLFLNNFDRLLENNGQLLRTLIQSVYLDNQTMESLQLMCHGINQTKVKAFEKQFNLSVNDHLTANYDGKCLTIERSKDFFN